MSRDGTERTEIMQIQFSPVCAGYAVFSAVQDSHA